MDAICKQCVEKMCLRNEVSSIPRENKRFENRLYMKVNFVRKEFIPHENNTTVFNSDMKVLLLTGNMGKAYNTRNLFCLHDRRNFQQFKLGAWRIAKICVLRFSFLKLTSGFRAEKRKKHALVLAARQAPRLKKMAGISLFRY